MSAGHDQTAIHACSLIARIRFLLCEAVVRWTSRPVATTHTAHDNLSVHSTVRGLGG